MNIDPCDIRAKYGSVAVMRAVLMCRASQIEFPGPRNCGVCPYADEDGNCKDLEIMRDALNVIDDIDIFSKRLGQLMDEGYVIKLSRNNVEVD
jgi:hypothetical protein